jgi:hypothetical protein
MLLAENSASLLPNLSAHRSTAFRLTAAAILDDGPNHSTGGRSHNHPFPFGQRDTEIPIIRFNCSPGRPCLPPLGSFGAFHAPLRRNWVRPPHSHTCRSSSLGSFGAFLLRRSYQPTACDGFVWRNSHRSSPRLGSVGRNLAMHSGSYGWIRIPARCPSAAIQGRQDVLSTARSRKHESTKARKETGRLHAVYFRR